MKTSGKYYIVLMLVFSSAAIASSDRICHYSGAFSISKGNIALGYTGSGKEFKSKAGYDRKRRIYFNVFSINAFRGSKYTFQAVSRYFKPRIMVVNNKNKRTESRVLGKFKHGWISKVTYYTDREYPDERIKVYITTTKNNHSKKLRGAEMFFQYWLQKEKCKYLSRGSSGNRSKPNPGNTQMPGLGGCPKGQYKSILGNCVKY